MANVKAAVNKAMLRAQSGNIGLGNRPIGVSSAAYTSPGTAKKAIAGKPVNPKSGVVMPKTAGQKAPAPTGYKPKGGLAKLIGGVASFLPIPGASLIGGMATKVGFAQEQAGLQAFQAQQMGLGGGFGGMLSGALGAVGGMLGAMPATQGVVKQWSTGTAQFQRLADGRIQVQKKNGVIKTYRPYHPIVIGKKMKVGTMRRAANRFRTTARALSTVLNLTTPRRSLRRRYAK